MADSETNDDDWVVNCSDDELSSKDKIWEPSPEEILSMYEILESKGVLEFEWQCPGRRSPSVSSIKSDMLDKSNLSDEDASKLVEPNEFDFNDEFQIESSSPKISPRKHVKHVAFGQKRVARLDKVMYDIQRHRKLDELEMQLNISASSPVNKNSNDGK